jgi:DNA relaxase NicK
MGVHITLPAQTLQNLQEDDKWLLRYFVEEGASISRLDFALDVLDKELNFNQLWALVQGGNFRCRLRKQPLRMQEAITGDTIYFGRMKSSICTRIYDKGAEQKVNRTWIRVETMMRHGRANHAAKLYAGTDVSIPAIIAGHVQIPDLEWWADVMTKTPEKTRLARPNANKRHEWLMKSVAPTLAKEIFLHGDAVYSEFKARVVDELQKLDEQARQKLDNSSTED